MHYRFSSSLKIGFSVYILLTHFFLKVLFTQTLFCPCSICTPQSTVYEHCLQEPQTCLLVAPLVPLSTVYRSNYTSLTINIMSVIVDRYIHTYIGAGYFNVVYLCCLSPHLLVTIASENGCLVSSSWLF